MLLILVRYLEGAHESIKKKLKNPKYKRSMYCLLLIVFLFGRVSSQCENSKAVRLGEMLQDVLDLNSTVQELVDIITKQVLQHF